MNTSIRSTLSAFVESVEREVAATRIDAHAEAVTVAARAVRRRAHPRRRHLAGRGRRRRWRRRVRVRRRWDGARTPGWPRADEDDAAPTATETPTQAPVDPATPAVPQRTVTVDPLLPTCTAAHRGRRPSVRRARLGPRRLRRAVRRGILRDVLPDQPDGDRYVRFPGGPPTPDLEWEFGAIVDWLPGTSLVVLEGSARATTFQVFDLMTSAPIGAVFTNDDAIIPLTSRLATPDSLIATQPP